MKVYGVTDWQKALSKLKGFHEHFQAQVTSVKRNQAVVPPEQEVCGLICSFLFFFNLFTDGLYFKKPNIVVLQAQFQKLCLDFLVLPEVGKPCHKEKIDELRSLFPKTKQWLDWWTMVDIEAILFPSKRAMITNSANQKDNLPDTTNAHESMHRLY
jgi:hypothetical protein